MRRRAGQGDEKKEGRVEGWEEGGLSSGMGRGRMGQKGEGGRGRGMVRRTGWREGKKEGGAGGWEEGGQGREMGGGRAGGKGMGRIRAL